MSNIMIRQKHEANAMFSKR